MLSSNQFLAKGMASQEVLPFAFDIIQPVAEKDFPFYTLPTVHPATFYSKASIQRGERSHDRFSADLVEGWIYSVIEGVDYTINTQEYFDCVAGKATYEQLARTLDEYRIKLNILRQDHLSLDSTIRPLMAQNLSNLQKIDSL